MIKMNKIYFIAVLFVVTLLSSCTKDETDGMPTLEVGALGNLIKDANTNSNLPPDDLKTMDVKFDLNVIADDEVSKVEISAFFNDDEFEGVYEVVGTKTAKITVTLERLLDALPDLTEDAIVKGSKVSFRVTEIVMVDGRVFADKEIETNQKDKDGNVIIIKPNNINDDFTTPSAVFNLVVSYYVACLSELDGTYTLTFTGTGGAGLGAPEPYNVTIEDVLIKRISPIEYSVSNCMGNLMKTYYSAYGGSTITGNFLDICGVFKPAAPISNGWHSNTYKNGVVDANGVITIEVNNNWGDSGTLVYTPNN